MASRARSNMGCGSRRFAGHADLLWAYLGSGANDAFQKLAWHRQSQNDRLKKLLSTRSITSFMPRQPAPPTMRYFPMTLRLML